MARPPITFTDTELRGILAAAADADAHAPASMHNAAFLDRFIAGVARATGRLYGQPVYVRLLDTAGIRRRPSAPTWSAAIARARSSPLPSRQLLVASAPAPDVHEGAAPDSLTAFERAPASARPAGDERDDGEMTALKVRAQVAEATLRDAYLKVGQLEAARADALQRVATAEAAARAAERRLQEVIAEREAMAGALSVRIDALAAAEVRLSGLERHLKLQTDQLRVELSAQAHDYKARLDAAEKALQRERSQTEALRRVLGDRGSVVE
ncbi:hypothetical protein [Paraburkholderia sacchari]|uniref:Uncharacterized protein n=1 Tax=Paraburkholderia sacchari TaxID=159450 RepID=A0A8T6ZLS8_9BURK|nr:hypothetical protein [Paraburkholderia sacchari]NLP65535.1 hypothetical protein [Paraburkholderia sacchari]